MSHFIVIYDEAHRGEPQVERIEDAEAAARRLVQVERELRLNTQRRVVMLTADDEATLRRTHSHYFVRSVDDLLEIAQG
jgi:hypothetical protein